MKGAVIFGGGYGSVDKIASIIFGARGYSVTSRLSCYRLQ